MPSTWIDTLEKGIRTRAFSIIGSPNILGSLMVLLIPVSIGFICSETRTLKKLAFAGMTFIMTLCLVVTYSRGAWIGFAVAMAVLALMIDKRLLIPAALGAVAVFIFVPSVGDRLVYLISPQYMKSSLTAGRAIRWLTGLKMLKENPLLGVGLGRFGGAVAMTNKLPGTFYMDNYFLKTAVEMGLIGLTAFCVLIYNALAWSFRALRNLANTRSLRPAQGALAGMIGVVIHNFVENVFEVPMMVTYFWLFAAIIIFLGYVYGKDEHNTVDQQNMETIQTNF
jgi:O-antigen ligase